MVVRRTCVLAGLALLILLLPLTFQFCFLQRTLVLNELPNNINDAPIASTRHILMALSGNETGVLEELQVALKSILLNGPVDHPMTIHIMMDDDAHKAVTDILDNVVHFDQWTSRNPIRVATYNVQALQDEWLRRIESRMHRAASIAHSFSQNKKDPSLSSLFRHKVGAYYRLFAAEVLPAEVETVLYMDTDVVILNSIEELWNIPGSPNRSSNVLFQWGRYRCSAFILLEAHQTEKIWELFEQVPTDILTELLQGWPAVGDQLVLRAIQAAFPDRVGPSLPPQWDVSAMNGPWKFKPGQLRKMLTHASMLHFNGGGVSSEAFWKQHSHYKKDPMWGLARYYVDLPWSWAQHVQASGPHAIKVDHIDILPRKSSSSSV
jgi:hypothetical protein